MSTYLPVGSIIKIRDVVAVVIGYDTQNIDGVLYDGYSIVKHPIGYIGSESVAFLSTNAEFNVIHIGFSTDEYTDYLQAQKNLFEVLQPLGEEKMNDQFNDISEAIIGKVEKHE